MPLASSPSPPPAPRSNVRAPSLLRRALHAGEFPPGYFVAALLALAAIWAHRYPAGIDLPQHANLVRLWVELRRGPIEYASFYQVALFTPYLLAYALAYPVAWAFNALTAMKLVLSLGALGSPWALARWLKSVGGEPRLGLLGFPIFFGFAYLWGLLSQCLALPLLFFYFSSFERQGERPKPWSPIVTALWGALLFFCHGITFGVAVLSSGLRVLARPRHLWRAGLHLLPLGLLTLAWLRARKAAVSEPPGPWFIDKGRLVGLFSSFFVPHADTGWAFITVLALIVGVILARPRVNLSPGAWIPFSVAMAGFVIVPEYAMSTSLIGPRFCVYVQAFALALFAPAAPGRRWLLRIAVRVRLVLATENRRRSRDRDLYAFACSSPRYRTTVAGRLTVREPVRFSSRFHGYIALLVVASLLLLNVRLYRFNVELRGLRDVAKAVVRYADVQSFLWKSDATSSSDVFGVGGLGNTPAWISAEKGGLFEHDAPNAFQMPIQFRGTPLPLRYEYIFARGTEHDVTPQVQAAFDDASLVASSGEWLLFRRKRMETGGIVEVRSAQEWGDLHADLSVTGTPLSVAGVVYASGFGTHARSFLRVRAPEGSKKLSGACGVDDASPEEARLSCVVRGHDGAVLWTSPLMGKGEAAREFAVPLGDDREVLLEVHPDGSINGDHADWVDLTAGTE
jgi:NPCBM/NEW2 domain